MNITFADLPDINQD